ncbi:YceI family protein [Polaromonas sp. P1(28)-13]|nr:YceI family protein [Polaromonas sp. P1(28)-13]
MKILAVALALSCACAQATEYRRVDPAGSHIRFTSRQMGVPVDGAFRKFDASLAFDPEAPAAAKGQLRIDLSSVDTGIREVNEEVVGAQWFDVRRHPDALRDAPDPVAGRRPVPGQRRPQPQGRQPAAGTERRAQGQWQPGSHGRLVPDQTPRFRDYGGAWGDVRVVANEVTVQFHLVLGP